MFKAALTILTACMVVNTANVMGATAPETLEIQSEIESMEEDDPYAVVENGTAITLGELTLRGVDNQPLATISEGEIVWVTGHFRNNRVTIQWNGISGHVDGRGLEHFDRKGVARAECPVWDEEGNLLGEIPEGTVVKITDPDGSSMYIAVEWEDQECYVLTDNLARGFLFESKEKQRLELYLDGYLFFFCDTVTGAKGTDCETPEGVFKIMECYHIYYMRGTVIRYCEYAFRFYGGYFIHDADGWRTIYGGDEWITNGSSGCVNIPREASAVLYKWVYEEMYFIITP